MTGFGTPLGAMRRGLISAVALVALAVPALAESKTSLVVSHPQEPPNWNYLVTSSSAIFVPNFINVVQPLVELLEDASAGPMLAESWEISEDGKQITFKLREANFHDGSTLDAGDVIYSLAKNKDSSVAAISVPLSVIEKMEAVDERTVRLSLSAPSQRLLKALGEAAGIIVPEGAYETYDPAVTMIGTGPYTFGEYVPDVHLQLNRFDGYWGEKPFFETITQRFISDETAATNALLAGEIDAVGAVLGEGLDRVESIAAQDRFDVLLPSPVEVSFVFLSTQNEALRNDKVRQAIAYGIDREALLLAGQSGYGRPMCQHIVPSAEPWNDGYCPYPYDPAKARALLAEAGYANGLTLDFPFLTVAEFPALKEVLVALMGDIGITLDTRPLDLATWLEQVWRGESYQFSNLTGGGKIDGFECGAGTEPLGKASSADFCIPEFDTLIDTADAILGRDEYIAAMSKMARIFADAAWEIPLYAKSAPTLYRADLVGLKSYRHRFEFDFRNVKWAE
ncbi:ABC transporter substrate-binding protein [Devosia sp.]|uniref:ABC transporter substrate-binding protein n=1 Tax=Devosia sp. TaxID=1871048 RepID=UPI002AFF9C32|nr:ABC transporter substrate-binding protein [Devosia sp.]